MPKLPLPTKILLIVAVLLCLATLAKVLLDKRREATPLFPAAATPAELRPAPATPAPADTVNVKHSAVRTTTA